MFYEKTEDSMSFLTKWETIMVVSNKWSSNFFIAFDFCYDFDMVLVFLYSQGFSYRGNGIQGQQAVVAVDTPTLCYYTLYYYFAAMKNCWRFVIN